MDSPKTTRSSRSRRKIFSCPVCDEVFIDEESLRRHELTHQNPEGEGEAPPAEEAAPTPPTPPEEESPSAVQEAPEAPAPRARPLSAVRRQAAAQQAAAQVEPEANFLPPDAPSGMPSDPDATLKVNQQNPSLAPLGWEADAKKTSSFGLGPLWSFIEDFSEWFVRGGTKTAGVVTFSVLSGVRLALWGLVVLTTAAACVYAGIWFGRVYGPRLWNAPVEQPVIPPVRTINNNPEANQQAVRELVIGFYQAINDKNYEEAYSDLSPAWQKEMSFQTFKNGYKDTQSARCVVKGVRSQAGGRYQMDIGLEVKERGRTRFFQGSYTATSTADGWKLDEGAIR